MTSLSFVKFLRFLRKGDKDFFDIPAAQQKTFLEAIPEPKNDIQRSLYQFKCQSFFWPKWKVPFYNIGAFFVFVPVLIMEWFRSAFVHKSHHYDAIGEFKGMEECIPDNLSEEYNIRHEDWLVKGMLKTKDIGYVLKVFLSSFPNAYFSLKLLLKLSQYNQTIYMYQPQAMVVHCEFSFASSILTQFCERKGVKHIDVMHGEKLYHIYDSFFRFSKCYVWSDYYKDLFIRLRAYPDQFVISVPPSLKIDLRKYKRPDVYADYKYYLADFTSEEIAGIVASMSGVKAQGKSVKYRLHPRYQQWDRILEYATKEDIEDPHEVTIQESVANCEFVVGSYSTVLAQAFMSGRKVVVDDVTYIEQYRKLAEYDYWLASENSIKLSEINKC